ncbi:hypothetical protein QTO34_015855, partial [Cnephaeus nilssonii]
MAAAPAFLGGGKGKTPAWAPGPGGPHPAPPRPRGPGTSELLTNGQTAYTKNPESGLCGRMRHRCHHRACTCAPLPPAPVCKLTAILVGINLKILRYDFVEVEDPSDGTILGRWCGSGTVPGKQISKGNQIRIRFVSDEYFPSEPGFCIHYNIVMPTTFLAKLVISGSRYGPNQNAAVTQGLPGTMKLMPFEVQCQQVTEAVSPSVLPPSALPLDQLNNAVTAFSTLEDLIRYLEPDRWQLDLEDLYRPTWHLLGKAFVFGRKSRVMDLNLLKEEVRLYSCTPRNFSVSIREELKRTDTIFWPGCLLVKRCGGNCACCVHNCNECQCVPSKVTKKYHEVLQLRPKIGVRGLHKSLTDVALEHHEECD